MKVRAVASDPPEEKKQPEKDMPNNADVAEAALADATPKEEASKSRRDSTERRKDDAGRYVSFFGLWASKKVLTFSRCIFEFYLSISFLPVM